MPDLGITVYGGAPGEIGGNRILLEWDEGGWMLDFGTRFAATSRYFMDHNGCLGFLRPDLPVYTGLVTAIIGKCLQGPKPTGPDGEFCYLAPRDCNGDVLAAAKRPRIQRKHYIRESGDVIETAMAGLREFWGSVPGNLLVHHSATSPLRHKRIHATATGGTLPVWAHSGKELF